MNCVNIRMHGATIENPSFIYYTEDRVNKDVGLFFFRRSSNAVKRSVGRSDLKA